MAEKISEEKLDELSEDSKKTLEKNTGDIEQGFTLLTNSIEQTLDKIDNDLKFLVEITKKKDERNLPRCRRCGALIRYGLECAYC